MQVLDAFGAANISIYIFINMLIMQHIGGRKQALINRAIFVFIQYAYK